MGMDPVNANEVHEVTIQVSDQVSVQAFNEFQHLLREFVKDASRIFADKPTNSPNKLLNVRVVRQAVRQMSQ